MDPVVYNLSNDAYHNSAECREYVSSSQLKAYARSPKAFRYDLDHPQEQTDAMRFGSLFHDLMASMAENYGRGNDVMSEWAERVAVFAPPVNEKTGQPYGAATKAYKEAYDTFLEANKGKSIATKQEVESAAQMASDLCYDCGSTSEQVNKLLKWGKPEASHFIEYKGCKFKFRPDLETKKKIVDWKTVATDDLSERSINGIIAKFGYDISAAMYLFFEHEQSGVWKTFYWCFVSKNPPYDAVLVDASKWTYEYDPNTGVVIPQVGAIKFQRLLDMHVKCVKENNWPGAEINIPKDAYGKRIMVANPPAWEISAAANILEQTYNE